MYVVRYFRPFLNTGKSFFIHSLLFCQHRYQIDVRLEERERVESVYVVNSLYSSHNIEEVRPGKDKDLAPRDWKRKSQLKLREYQSKSAKRLARRDSMRIVVVVWRESPTG